MGAAIVCGGMGGAAIAGGGGICGGMGDAAIGGSGGIAVGGIGGAAGGGSMGICGGIGGGAAAGLAGGAGGALAGAGASGSSLISTPKWRANGPKPPTKPWPTARIFQLASRRYSSAKITAVSAIAWVLSKNSNAVLVCRAA